LSLTYRTLYPVVFIEAILLTVVLYTQEYPIKDTLASCTTFFSVLCKLLKDLVLLGNHSFLSESGCKGTTIF